jgi:hypothetical protein
VPFTKGLALEELANRLEIGKSTILAVGNGHNDISMLGADVAGLIGCPSNSEAEVMRVVHNRGGHIAEKRALGGVLEILESYHADTVNSNFPAWWVDPPKALNTRHIKHAAKHKKTTRQLRFKSLFIMIGVIYVALIVFARFEIIPFSDYILKPFTILSKGVDYMFSAMYK